MSLEARSPRAALFSLLLLTACTDVPLRSVSSGVRDRVGVRGDFCTTRPATSDFPVRVLFLVDSAGSMAVNDPSNKHVDAMEAVVQRFAPSQNVTFGIVRFGDRVVRELVDYAGTTPALFTNDQTILNQAFTRMRQPPSMNPDKYLGGTNYELALDAAREYIVEDLAANPELIVLARYFVVFMTDGMPQAADVDPMATRNSILAKVEDLTENYNARLDAVSIVEFTQVPPEFFDLLPVMAQSGHGIYFPLTSPAALDHAFQQLISNEIVVVEYERESLLVFNDAMLVAEVDGLIDAYPDSDGDGIIDRLERDAGTDPRYADTDGDGLDDFFEVKLSPEYDPKARNVPALSEVELADVDRDGLNFAVESRLGLDPLRPDTDGDTIPDGIEFRRGTDPQIDDTRGDYDQDGISNLTELREHTNPRLAEPAAVRAAVKYQVEPDAPPFAEGEGRRCYTFNVADMRLAETLRSVGPDGNERPAGFNQIHVVRLERPAFGLDDARRLAKVRRVVQGATWMLFRPDTFGRDPAAVELLVRDYHFEP